MKLSNSCDNRSSYQSVGLVLKHRRFEGSSNRGRYGTRLNFLSASAMVWKIIIYYKNKWLLNSLNTMKYKITYYYAAKFLSLNCSLLVVFLFRLYKKNERQKPDFKSVRILKAFTWEDWYVRLGSSISKFFQKSTDPNHTLKDNNVCGYYV